MNEYEVPCIGGRGGACWENCKINSRLFDKIFELQQQRNEPIYKIIEFLKSPESLDLRMEILSRYTNERCEKINAT